MGLFNNLFKKRTKQVEDSKQLVIELGGKGGITPVYCIGPDGVFESETYDLVVSRGLGNSLPVPRFFNNPEIVCVQLHCN